MLTRINPRPIKSKKLSRNFVWQLIFALFDDSVSLILFSKWEDSFLGGSTFVVSGKIQHKILLKLIIFRVGL